MRNLLFPLLKNFKCVVDGRGSPSKIRVTAYVLAGCYTEMLLIKYIQNDAQGNVNTGKFKDTGVDSKLL